MRNPALEIEDHAQAASLLRAVADYAAAATVISDSAIRSARLCLIDALGRGFETLREPASAALIGPLVPGALMPGGSRVPGTSLELDPAQAAFCNALLFCRPAAGDRPQASGSGCAADPLGAILAVADYQARQATMEGKSPPKVRDVLAATVKTLQIQDAVGVEGPRQAGTAMLRCARVATAAMATAQLGGTQGQIFTALRYACLDGPIFIDAEPQHDIGHGEWATADAVSRAVRHACQALAARSSSLTPIQLEAMDIAASFLGVKSAAGRPRFGSGASDRLTGRYPPHELAPLTMRFHGAVDRHFPARQAERIKGLFAAPARLDDLPVNELLAALVTNGATGARGAAAAAR